MADPAVHKPRADPGVQTYKPSDDPSQKYALRNHNHQKINKEFIDPSNTNILHLQSRHMEPFPEDFLDDPMPMPPPSPPPPKSSEPAKTVQKPVVVRDVEMDFEDDSMKNYKFLLDQEFDFPEDLMYRGYSAPVRDPDEIVVDFPINLEPDFLQRLEQRQTDQLKKPQLKAQPCGEENQEPVESSVAPAQTFDHNSQEMTAEAQAPLAEKVENRKKKSRNSARARQSSNVSSSSSGGTTSTSAKNIYRPNDPNCPLNAPIDESIPVDTRELCDYVRSELKRLGIQQYPFAKIVLGRAQGTLSDILKNPRPWNELKAGREPFVRMFNWLMMSTEKKLEAVESGKDENEIQVLTPNIGGSKRGSKSKDDGTAPKRPRIVFTSFQKEVLDASFEANREPSKAHQEALARELDLELKSVANFFTNARRRRRYNIQKTIKEEVNDYDELLM